MVYLLICYFQTYNINLILFISFFCLRKRLLKGNIYFEEIKQNLENWRGDTKTLLFGALWFILRGDLLYILPCAILLLCLKL